MARKKRRGNKRQGDFRVVARGVRRVRPDIPRITKASLDFYLASKEREAQGTSRSHETKEAVDGSR